MTTATPTPQAAAFLVGTSRLDFGGQAGSGTTQASGSTALPSSVSASQMPRTPDAGDAASAQTVHAASLSHASGVHKSNPTYPTVTGSTVAGPTGGLATAAGVDAYNQGVTHPAYSASGAPLPLPGVDIEPPDQGVCAGNGYVLEVNNMVATVFSKGLQAAPAAPLESLFGTPEVFGAANDGTYSVQGDPRCFYDAATKHWFASQLWLDFNDATQFGWAGTFVAVSKTADPTGTWNVYFVPDADNATGTAGCNNQPPTSSTLAPCFGDQPLLGVDGNTVQLSTNEYSLVGSTPAGAANLYFLSKSAMEQGAKSVTTYWSPVGTVVPAPGGGPWYSLAPAQAPDGRYLTANGGTSFGLSSLDFTGAGDNRIAEWAYTDTSAANTGKGAITISEQTLSSGQYAMPPALVAQQAGPTPLGDNWNRLILGSKSNAPLPEGGIAANDDRMATATYDPSNGALVGGLNTGVNQVRSGSTVDVLAGIATFTVTPALTSAGLAASAVTTSYISPNGANALFPAAAITTAGTGAISYTLTGTGYYPSQAYSTVAAGDVVDPTTHVASAGAGPQDGFSEYQSAGTSNYRPRWGDYGEAVATGSTVTFATEMIHSACSDAAFSADFTCGGTRDLFANWGTEVSTLNLGG